MQSRDLKPGLLGDLSLVEQEEASAVGFGSEVAVQVVDSSDCTGSRLVFRRPWLHAHRIGNRVVLFDFRANREHRNANHRLSKSF